MLFSISSVFVVVSTCLLLDVIETNWSSSHRQVWLCLAMLRIILCKNCFSWESPLNLDEIQHNFIITEIIVLFLLYFWVVKNQLGNILLLRRWLTLFTLFSNTLQYFWLIFIFLFLFMFMFTFSVEIIYWRRKQGKRRVFHVFQIQCFDVFLFPQYFYCS